jgi:hypothetical protein
LAEPWAEVIERLPSQVGGFAANAAQLTFVPVEDEGLFRSEEAS